jgi:phage shock protein PspC (stress-responsive transcriptional regulator)
MSTRRVARSLTDRVFGGVCGGLGGYLGLNAWWARLAFIVLTPLSGGVVGLLYLILWWTMGVNLTPGVPNEGRDLGTLLLVALMIAMTGAVILARGAGILTGPGGADLFWPAMVALAGAALLWQQVRRA